MAVLDLLSYNLSKITLTNLLSHNPSKIIFKASKLKQQWMPTG